jgi:hypothetical protein
MCSAPVDNSIPEELPLSENPPSIPVLTPLQWKAFVQLSRFNIDTGQFTADADGETDS